MTILPVLFIIASLLGNGGFEDGKDSPAFWHVNTIGDVKGQVQWGKNVVFDSKIFKSGRRSVKFLMNEKAAEFESIASIEGFGFESDLIPVQFGKKYIVSADIRAEGKTSGRIPYVLVFVKGYKDDPDKGKFQVFQFQMDCEFKKEEEGEWRHFETDFPIPKESIKEVRVILYACYPAGIVWFDNIDLREVTEANN